LNASGTILAKARKKSKGMSVEGKLRTCGGSATGKTPRQDYSDDPMLVTGKILQEGEEKNRSNQEDLLQVIRS